ncbi:MAG TPA: response regulator [Candidatus Limnocylindria bacterium]
MRTVLVLDDDVTIAELLRVVLTDAGYDVTVSMDAGVLPDGPFDCIVSDLMSVAVYRYEDARDWILRVGDRFPNVPVIVVTAHPEAASDRGALGAAAVIMKPFDVDRIVQAVREVTA